MFGFQAAGRKEGELLILRGITRKAKNRIHEWGDRWIIHRIDGHDFMIVAEKDNTPNLPDSARWFSNKEFEIVG